MVIDSSGIGTQLTKSERQILAYGGARAGCLPRVAFITTFA